ncbi:MAG: hypothetical protein ACRD5H_00260, partial [Nitrososphaerales archaeon]
MMKVKVIVTRKHIEESLILSSKLHKPMILGRRCAMHLALRPFIQGPFIVGNKTVYRDKLGNTIAKFKPRLPYELDAMVDDLH